MNGHKPDNTTYRIERATITKADPGKHDKPYQVDVWRVIQSEEYYFHYNTEEEAKEMLRMFSK